MEPIKTGLWAKEHNGNISYSGQLKMPDGTSYWVNLYLNDKKSENSPDYNIYLKPKN